MRPIKFRAREIIQQGHGVHIGLGGFVYGSLVLRTCDGFQRAYIHCPWDETQPDRERVVEVDPSTIGQFTGLHDKNEKEIYEGDILHHVTRHGTRIGDHGNRVCEWDEKRTGFYFRKALEKDGWGWAHAEDMEVIGNRWENPELLEPSHAA